MKAKSNKGLWEISLTNHLIQKARLIATNTNVDELVEYNKYLVVDKFMSYIKVKGKRRILSCEQVNSQSTTPVGSAIMTPSLSKMQ